jgi:serine/threonine-protein kinase
MLTGDVPFHGENQVAVAMKHVREELPDVQLRRPEVSSALAAVLDRATAKDLRDRYATAEELIDDLAEVLSIETARTGQATGEVTTVLRTLPPSAQRRVPLRHRHPARLVAAAVLVVVAATVAFILLADRAERGTGSSNVKAPPGLKTVSLGQGRANDFDPLGDNREEHPLQAKQVVDRLTQTFWDTEAYRGSTLGKDGVGIYVDAKPDVRARAIEVLTRTPGWRGTIYGAPNGPAPDELSGFRRLAAISATERRTRVRLDLGRARVRYYLVWITALPPGEERVAISEIRLFR